MKPLDVHHGRQAALVLSEVWLHKPLCSDHRHRPVLTLPAAALPQQRSGRRTAIFRASTPVQTAPVQQAPPPAVKHPVQLKTLPVTRNITLLRATCLERPHEIQFGQRRGTTTNSYLIKGPSGAAEVLIDVPSKDYDYDLSSWLSELGVLSTLRTVIITRLNPERIPPLKKVLAAVSGPVHLLASNPALQLLRQSAEGDAELAALLARVETTAITRSTGLRLGSGAGGRLRFVPIPTPRWPDLAAVYSDDDKALFSSSFFAAHIAPCSSTAAPAEEEGAAAAAPLAASLPSAFDDGGWEVYGTAWRYYFDCMLAPAAKQAAVALDRLRINAVPSSEGGGLVGGMLRSVASFVKELTLGADDGQPEPLEILCPIHGPAVRTSLTELIRRYADWTSEQVAAAGTASVAVLYASAYGNTAALAQAISRGITKAGVGVETLNLEVVGVEEVERELESAAGFVIGSPTLGGHMPTQVQTALGAILRAGGTKGLPCGVFGSFGWSGEAVDMMEGKLKDAGFQFAFPSLRCKFKPTEAVLQQCEESGTDLAQAIKRNLRKKERAAAETLSVAETASGPALAVGRVVGSLCVLTARDGDAESAMLASWVSQASFDPPGLTVAVKKDRAVENLLPVGNKFVLNVLAEGKDRAVMKALLKPFAPGEDRFAGLEVRRSEVSGAAVLSQAAAYLECTVAQRMEGGDHWILYGTVEDGKVLDEGAQSAVHFRKTGTNY